MEEVNRIELSDDKSSDVEKIVNSINSKLRAASASAGREAASCTIYRVPKAIRQGNEKSFEPQLMSIGPYHINSKEVKAMEGKKLEHLQSILRRNRSVELKAYVKEMKELEDRAKKCYSDYQSISRSCLEGIESVEMDDGKKTRELEDPAKKCCLGGTEFVEMMLLDGCFLVDIFLQSPSSGSSDQEQEQGKQQQGFDWCWRQHFVSFDMLLLENQLPFFVLEAIFRLVEGEPLEGSSSLKDLALDCFAGSGVMTLNKCAAAKDSYNHLLDLFHHHCLPPSLTRPKSRLMQERPDPDIDGQIMADRRDLEAQPIEEPLLADDKDSSVQDPSAEGRRASPEQDLFAIPSAEQLQNSGIEFKKKKNNGSFLDIGYDEKKGAIEIPYLYFSDNLKSIFQNLIAYEQCCPGVGTFFTGYAFFMDDVINTGKDVRILRHSEILEHGLGSDEELAQHFNQLNKGVFYEEEKIHLWEERRQINKYCKNPYNIWRATLKREYFYSPWAALSLAGAILGLAIAIFQVALSVYSTLI